MHFFVELSLRLLGTSGTLLAGLDCQTGD